MHSSTQQICSEHSKINHLEWVAVSFSWGPSQPGIEPGSPALQADFLPAELQEKADCLLDELPG